MTTDWDAHRTELPTLLDAIGRTPLIRLQRVAPKDVELLAKVEADRSGAPTPENSSTLT